MDERVEDFLAKDSLNFPNAADVPPGDLGAAFFKMIISLVILVLLLWVTVYFLRKLIQHRLQKGNTEQSIQILEKRMISPKTMLYLIEIEGKTVLLAESHLEVKKVAEFTSHEPNE